MKTSNCLYPRSVQHSEIVGGKRDIAVQ